MARTHPVEQETFDVYADPGHAWVKVPKATLKALGIAGKITPYSYQRGEFAYLEEDQDAVAFADAMWQQRRIIVKYREHIANKDSKIRNYDQYDPRAGQSWSSDAPSSGPDSVLDARTSIRQMEREDREFNTVPYRRPPVRVRRHRRSR
jgi:hypothetical protein